VGRTKLGKGEQVPSQVWERFCRLLGTDVAQRCGAMEQQEFAVAFAIYQRSERDFLRALFGESLTFVLLNVPEELLAERIIARTTQKAESKGMTFEQYINAFHPGNTVEQVLEGWKIRRSGFEPKQEGEPNTIQIDVTREMGKDDVARKAAALLDSVLKRNVGLGWSSQTLDVNIDALWAALDVKARSPEKFMDVTSVTVSDEDGFLLRSMTLRSNNKTVRERIRIDRVASEIVYQPLQPDSGVPMDEERVIAVRSDPNLHLEYFQRFVTDGMRSLWALPVDVLSKSVQELTSVAKKLEATVESVVGLGLQSASIDGVDHDALWVSMLNEVRNPRAHARCSITDCDGFVERKLLSSGTTQHVYVREDLYEIAYREVTDGTESRTEFVIILRGHPLQIELCERNVSSGFRVHSTIPKSEATTLIDLMVVAARKVMVQPPATVGLGLCSAPISGVSYDSLFVALELTTLKPWLIRDVDQSNFKFTDCVSHVERVVQRPGCKEEKDKVTVNEEKGEVSYQAVGADVERVAAILKNPSRFEVYQRTVRDKMRVEWALPYDVAQNTMSKMAKLAREIDESASDVVGYGMVSHTMTSSRDRVWRAMLSFLPRPADCGMPVDEVTLQHKKGYMVRSMRLISTNTFSTDNIYINEAAQEIIFRAVQGGVEGTDERVLSLRTEPLRCEIHCRNAATQIRVYWKAPRSTVGKIFNYIDKAASLVN
jgi:hypothetical protein